MAEAETLEEDAFDEDHYERLLYGALSFDLHLEEAHLLLAKLYRERLIDMKEIGTDSAKNSQAASRGPHLNAH